MSRRTGSERTVVILLILSDLLAVILSVVIAFFLRKHAPLLDPLMHGLDVYINAWPALVLWPLIFWREGLYPGFWLSVREELRKTVTGTTLASILAMALTFVTKTGPIYSRPIIVGAWMISLVLIPSFRFLTRRLIKGSNLSGPPAVILGAGKTARIIIDGLARQRPPALVPVGIFDDNPEKHGQMISGLPVIGNIQEAGEWAFAHGIRVAIISMPGVPREKLIPIVEKQSKVFPRILVIPDLFGISAADVDAHEVAGVLALEMRKNLLYRRNRIAKRVIDLLLLVLGLVFIIPLTLLIGFAILIESGRPVIFKHTRVGREGAPFEAWKYRTMVQAADEILNQALEEDHELQKEWDETQKLKHDPRLTRVGKILRRLSLDELPQLWNVVRGEMSLVGPRPIIESEIPRYGENYDLFIQVRPGLTGLWQVSGRSDLSYEDRVWLDTHYVRNWSVWLDLVILVRTVWVVIAGVGAY